MKKWKFLHYMNVYSPITILSATEEAAYNILKKEYPKNWDEYYLN